ncbi:4732_t:CDS:2, partial [Rhizophagus irregularis]
QSPTKTSKRNIPYNKTLYEATKAKYNLRSNKQAKGSAEDSEYFPATNEELTFTTTQICDSLSTLYWITVND